jgi:hypothetical protein
VTGWSGRRQAAVRVAGVDSHRRFAHDLIVMKGCGWRNPMSSVTIERLYEETVRGRSTRDRMRLVELIAHDLGGVHAAPPTDAAVDDATRQALSNLRRHAGAVSLGHATGDDNDGIDADLAEAYGSSAC